MRQRLPSAMPVIKNHLERTLKIKWDTILKDPAVRKKGCKWNFGYLMQMLSYSILSGCKNLREMETFTERYDERIPDTTMNDKIIGIDATPLRKLLASQVKDALHDHELDKEDFPMRVTAIDGKSVSISKIKAGSFSQPLEDNGKHYYNNRGLRAMHVSNSTKLFLGQREIFGKSSETTEFKPFLVDLCKSYGNTKLLEVISVDAGMTSKENADCVKENKLEYIMALKGPQQTLLSNAEYLFNLMPEPTITAVEKQNGKMVVRKLYRFVVPPQYKHEWDHLQEFWKIVQITTELKSGKSIEETRYFLSSIVYSKLSDKQVLAAIRMHWGIENNGNWISDVCLGEDESPFANKALVLISLIRLIVYNVISRLMYRRLRAAKARQLSWRSLMSLIAEALKQLQESQILQEYMYPAFET